MPLAAARGHRPVGGLSTTPAALGGHHLFTQSVIRREVLHTQCDGHALKGPNDIVFDKHGGMWFTDFGITSISPDGKKVEHMVLPAPLTTNICFGGKDMRTAYATLSGTGKLVAYDAPRAGLRLKFNA